MTQFPSKTPPTTSGDMPLAPHRGAAILTLGILGIVPCFICGIFAWVMANNDLQEMKAGRMDPDGMQFTQAGKICGMVGVILAAASLAMQILVMGCMAIIAATAGTAAWQSGM